MVSVQHLLDQCRHRTTIVFGNLDRWPDRVTHYKSEYPYTLFFEPNIGVHVTRSFGKTVIVFTSHLDLTWDKGVDLKFFHVGHSRLVKFGRRISLKIRKPTLWISRTHATGGRVRDLVAVVGRLGNASRREPTLACSVSPPWKRALETHAERSHQNALAHRMPSDVLDHIKGKRPFFLR
ncbi:uncharacterized protein TNCV_5132301 [Trichonephila clavipes]|nr:uncharacterized protein TNCV_5132301 [Trichonephila clavipes]